MSSGLRVGWLEFGDPTGFPVFYCHGTPGSALEASVFATAARRHGARIIAVDRPGIADSDLGSTRTVADWSETVSELALHLGLAEFSLLGWSGGAPHALLAGVRLESHVRAIGLLAPQGHTATWQSLAENLLAAPLNSSLRVLMKVPLAGLGIVSLSYRIDDLRHHSPRPSGLYREVLARSLQRAMRRGTRGTIEDAAALAAPWGLTMPQMRKALLSAHPPLPITLWQGQKDTFVRPTITAEMAAQLPHSQLIFDQQASHLQILLDHTDEVLSRMLRKR